MYVISPSLGLDSAYTSAKGDPFEGTVVGVFRGYNRQWGGNMLQMAPKNQSTTDDYSEGNSCVNEPQE